MLSDHLNSRLVMQTTGEKAAGVAMPVNVSSVAATAVTTGIRRPLSGSDEETNSSNSRKRLKKSKDISRRVEESKRAATGDDASSSLLNSVVHVDHGSPKTGDTVHSAAAANANVQLQEAQFRVDSARTSDLAAVRAHQGIIQGLGGGLNPLPNIDSIQAYASVQPNYLLQQNQGTGLSANVNSQGYPGYLQGYLNGLQQAKAASTNQESLIGGAPLPQSTYAYLPAAALQPQATLQSDLDLYLATRGHQTLSGLGAGSLGRNPFLSSLPPNPQLGGFVALDPLLGSVLGHASLSQSLHSPGLGGFHSAGNPSALLGQGSVGQLGVVGGMAAATVQPADGYPACLPVPLSRSDDAQNLTSHQILLRQQIEVFEATEDDANTHTRGRNKPVMIGQVGVRCKHCKHIPVLQRQKGSTYFPNSMLGIYQAAQNMNTVHMQCGLCSEMPEEVKRQFVHSMCYSKVHQSGAGRQYWARSAKKLGLVDTESHGIRFIRKVPQDAKVVDI